MGDVNQLIIEEGIAHWPVFAGVGLMMIAMWRWIIPSSVRSALDNGGGDAVRRVINAELYAQDQRIDEKLEQQNGKIEQRLKALQDDNKDRLLEMITKHEEVERITNQNVLLKLKSDFGARNDKMNKLLEELNERTTHIERKLKMKRRAVTLIKSEADNEGD